MIVAHSTASFKVLNHGDCWVNNMLFKYERGQPVDVIFIDFQLSFYSSPGIDLNYFFHTSAQNEVRNTKLRSLINIYYNTFLNTMIDINMKFIPTLADLRREIDRCDFSSLGAAIGMLPTVLLDQSDMASPTLQNMSDEKQGNNLRLAMYANEAYVEAVQPILQRLNDYDVLDYLITII